MYLCCFNKVVKAVVKEKQVAVNVYCVKLVVLRASWHHLIPLTDIPNKSQSTRVKCKIPISFWFPVTSSYIGKHRNRQHLYLCLSFHQLVSMINNILIKTILSQFEIALSASTRCLCVCLFYLKVDMLCCFHVQICMPELIIQIQNTIWNTIYFALSSLRETLQICSSKLQLDQTTIINYH